MTKVEALMIAEKINKELRLRSGDCFSPYFACMSNGKEIWWLCLCKDGKNCIPEYVLANPWLNEQEKIDRARSIAYRRGVLKKSKKEQVEADDFSDFQEELKLVAVL